MSGHLVEERNIRGYLACEFEGLDERPLGDVDSLVLSCLSYYRLPQEASRARTHEGMALGELFRAEWFEPMTRGLWDPEGLVRLLAAAVASPRLRGLRVSDYEDDFSETQEKQFSACTLRLPGGGAYVSFRGTDNTLVGWKEDFNMAFETGVPSQLAAVRYLERVAPSVDGPLYLGGHSKGGNLAVYAAARCPGELAARIERVFSHDGPGFTSEALADEAWRERAHLVSKTVPHSSVIGMLFERQEDYAVVESSTTALAQHDPFSWVVEGADFVRHEGLARGASFLDESLNQWIASMTHAEREGFVDALFSVFAAGGEDTFGELGERWQTSVPAMLREVARLEPEQRGHITRALALLVRSFVPDVSLPQVPELEPLRLPDLEALLPGRIAGDGKSSDNEVSEG
ncbi:Mbeg1-like protein [Olsenella sp. An188]|uniref:Mbeg1-like protein n=1 Tax=Olsenella sp. An188 TaxID=1965579 RepID=UPI000B3A9746|nr:Mbeg1-like protein [Olsenella sp. An188]OUP39787.1 hypothetical protein B5F23_02070 [Olsenella sp. An188]HJB54424.1 DUF2974 domain-containing protein [Candidatus Olsenella avistercoris]